MDSILVIILFALFAVLSDQLGGKKKVPSKRPLPQPRQSRQPKQAKPPQRPRRTFDIALPSSASEPPVAEPAAAPPVPRPRPVPTRHRMVPTDRPVAVAASSLTRPESSVGASALQPQLTPESARQAVVLAEILGRPRAYRRFRH